jgi:hypothetical protein
LREGIKFLPLKGILFDTISVGITKKNLDFPAVKFRTPDRAELEARISITIVPSEKYIINFLNSGGMEGAMNIIQDAISERIRTWGISEEEGPANWMEAQGSSSEALAAIFKDFFADEFKEIPIGTPISSLIEFFSITRSEIIGKAERKKGDKLTADEENAACAWYDDIARKLREEEGASKAREAAYGYLRLVADIEKGKIERDIPDLGVRVLRANMSYIHVIGATAEAAELEAKEAEEKAAEMAEIEHVMNLANMLVKSLNLTEEEAMKIVMTERGKITRKVEDKNISFTIPSELLDSAKALLNSFNGK